MVGSEKVSFFRNTAYNVAFGLLTQAIAIFIVPLFVKNLGADLYGIWVLSGVVIGYFELMDLGFGVGFTKYISEAYHKQNYSELKGVVNTAVALFLFIGAAICLITVLFRKPLIQLFSISQSNIPTAESLLLLAGLFCIVAWPMKITNIVFQGTLKFKEQSYLNGISAVGSTSVILGCAYFGVGIVPLTVIYYASRFVLWLPAYLVMSRALPEFSLDPASVKIETVRKTVGFSFGIFYYTLLSMLLLQSDTLIIGYTLSMSAITAYTVGSKLFKISGTYIGMLSGVLWSTVFKANAQDNRSVLDKMFLQGTKYMAILTTPVGYLGVLVSPYFIDVWIGKEYTQYAIWSQLLMLVFLFDLGMGIAPNIAMASGRIVKVNAIFTIRTLINLVISIAFVKRYGIGGPILGTVVSQIFLSNPVTFSYFCRLIDVEWKPSTKKVYAILMVNLPAFVGFYWISRLVPQWNWASLIAFSVAFCLVEYAVSYKVFLSRNERQDLRHMVGSLNLLRSRPVPAS
jgi:O-antigen/teichoic acid export membrane protein